MKVFLARGGSLAEDVTASFLSVPGFREAAGRMTAEELEGMLNGAADPVPGTAPLPGDRFAAAPDRVWVGWGFNAGASGYAKVNMAAKLYIAGIQVFGKGGTLL